MKKMVSPSVEDEEREQDDKYSKRIIHTTCYCLTDSLMVLQGWKDVKMPKLKQTNHLNVPSYQAIRNLVFTNETDNSGKQPVYPWQGEGGFHSTLKCAMRMNLTSNWDDKESTSSCDREYTNKHMGKESVYMGGINTLGIGGSSIGSFCSYTSWSIALGQRPSLSHFKKQ